MDLTIIGLDRQFSTPQ